MNSDVRMGSSPILGTNINNFKFNTIMTEKEYEVKYTLGKGEYIKHLYFIGDQTLNIKYIKEEIARRIINELFFGDIDKSMLYYDTLRALVNNIQIVEIY